MKHNNILKKKIKLNGVQVLVLGFLITIIVGTLLLMLPISSIARVVTNPLDALFTATSAVCVTGLITIDTGTYWSLFGQIVIITLIEVGGLGFMTFGTLFAMLLGKKITLKERLVIKESVNAFNIQGVVRLIRHIFLFTILVQIGGGILLSFAFIPKYGVIKGIYMGLFHAVSAFCNAGFDLIGKYRSLTYLNNNIYLLLVVSALIIIGGLGFYVWIDIYKFRSRRKLAVHSKIVIMITSILLLGGTLLMLFVEYKNPHTLLSMDFPHKIANSFFSTVTARTAGFNSIDTNLMTNGGKALTVFLMFIGGSPGSTAGGLKTATFGLIIITVISVVKGKEDTEAFGRSFSKEVVYKAFALLFIAVALVLVVTFVLCITQPGEKFIDLLFEATSAFATTGITTGVTQRLDTIGKIVIIITMYCGRVGPLTLAVALTKQTKKKKGYKYPEGKILIG